MSLGTPDSPALTLPPRVVWRSAAGVGLLLLAIQLPTLGRPASSESATIVADQARLRLDPNVATRDELMLLPRLGPALADAIIKYRESAGLSPAFSCAEDLDNVYRIGPATVEQLRPLLCFPPTRARDGGTEVHTP
jgi:competence ComEA-like helix-hairpin-helix protein